MFATPPLPKLVASLADPARSVGERMRAVYYLKQTYTTATKDGDSEAVATVLSAMELNLSNKEHGKLLRHEIAYVMGQLKDYRCLLALASVLDDGEDDCIARHECAEAIGAIVTSKVTAESAVAVQSLRRNYASEEASPVEVRETCRIAIDFIDWKTSTSSQEEYNAPMACACMLSSYDSTDPAPPHPAHENLSHEEIGEQMRDEARELFERYRCMFSLRNKGGSEAAKELGRALVEDKSSALFRHELAFVLGQLQHVDGLDFLVQSLEREGEHEFVRHESAEAIGAIDGDWDKCERILVKFKQDHDLIVRQSCEVALDAMDYFGVDRKDTFRAIKNDSTVTSHFNIACKRPVKAAEAVTP
ncbi:hypothetical protein TeGR_g3988 [Tetraparma gracilis]|uniref:Deoxyhypusine hydroxylase n=1 Tax=Tetraparma gracilis TaxID=2962635 RepID=A0ABQ6MEK2_9STRA|nr:hypothetical protein TeGR_g3988 [Tetraparma gracilis]